MLVKSMTHKAGSLKMNTALEYRYSTRVVQEGDRRCKKSTLNDLAYLTPLRIPLMNPVLILSSFSFQQPHCLENNFYGFFLIKILSRTVVWRWALHAQKALHNPANMGKEYYSLRNSTSHNVHKYLEYRCAERPCIFLGRWWSPTAWMNFL